MQAAVHVWLLLETTHVNKIKPMEQKCVEREKLIKIGRSSLDDQVSKKDILTKRLKQAFYNVCQRQMSHRPD